MGNCIYNTWNDGCSMYDEDEFGIVKHFNDTDYGFVGKGDCVVEDDEYPENSCCCYESNDPDEDEDE